MRWENEILIEAPAETVWQLTIDIAGWPSTTPTVSRVERLDDGPVQVGSRARIKQPGQPVALWTVTKVEPGREFVWQTKRWGLVITAAHHIDAVGQQTRNRLKLDAAGPASRLFALLFGGRMRTLLQTENAGFKARAETTG
jgi:uncharacterized membrane protein